MKPDKYKGFWEIFSLEYGGLGVVAVGRHVEIERWMAQDYVYRRDCKR
jgi:hypothetical protein